MIFEPETEYDPTTGFFMGDYGYSLSAAHKVVIIYYIRETVNEALEVVDDTIGTLSNTTPPAGRGDQFFQLINLSPGNTYQLKEVTTTSC